MCNSINLHFDRVAILIGSQRESFSAVAHCPVESFLRGATVKEIKLTQGKVALVDDEDYDRFSGYKWYAVHNGDKWYAANKKFGFLHRAILTAPRNRLVDHKDGNGLDCRRQNIRLATRAQNTYNSRVRSTNTSGFRGVSASSSRWLSQIKHNGATIYLGTFGKPEDAARAYDVKVRELHGEFGRTNF